LISLDSPRQAPKQASGVTWLPIVSMRKPPKLQRSGMFTVSPRPLIIQPSTPCPAPAAINLQPSTNLDLPGSRRQLQTNHTTSAGARAVPGSQQPKPERTPKARNPDQCSFLHLIIFKSENLKIIRTINLD
jgi:hypothetical protein